MGILLWIIFGAIAGWLASVVMSTDHKQGTVTDIILGIVGAVIGGMIMEFLGYSGVSGFNLYSMFVAVLGAMAVLYIGRLLHR